MHRVRQLHGRQDVHKHRETSPARDRTLSRGRKAIGPTGQSTLWMCTKLWHEKLTGVLNNMGFKPNPVDPCIMNKMIDGKQCTLSIFVDDILALSVDTKTLEWLLAELRKEFDDVKAEIGNDLSYLGMHIQLNFNFNGAIPERPTERIRAC